jgi:hypothetical protein
VNERTEAGTQFSKFPIQHPFFFYQVFMQETKDVG